MKEKPTSFVISIPMEPVPKGRPRFSRRSGVAFTPAKTRSAEAEMKWHIEEKIKSLFGDTIDGVLFEGPCMVSINFNCSRPESVKRLYHTVKPDLDNLVKGLFDCCNNRIWRDDCQVIRLKVDKDYTSSRPSIFMTVVELCDYKANKMNRKKEKENG